MDDIPECVRRRPRRPSAFQGDAREESTDGDYISLRESRKNLSKRKTFDDFDEDDDYEDDNPILVTSVITEACPQDNKILLELFEKIVNGTVDEINELSAVVDITMLQYVTSVGEFKGMNMLHYALHHQRFDIAEILIKKAGAFLASQSFSLSGCTRTALHQITEYNQVHLAKLLLNTKSLDEQQRLIQEETVVVISEQRARSFSCYHLAAFKGLTELVRLYLGAGICVNSLNGKKDTALLWAARWGHYETVTFLLDSNADANIENDKKSTALHWAVRYQNSETVKLLLKKGNVNPNHVRSMGLVAPLIMSSAIGNIRITKALIAHGADVNIVIRGGECPVHHAAKEGHTRVVKILLKHGADVNIQDGKGDMAINLASQKGHSDIVNILLNHGADMFHDNDIGENCWESAILQDDNDVIRVLAKYYVVAKMRKEFSGVLPICVAAKLGRCKKVKVLLQQKNIDPLEEDFDGNSCLHYAAMYNRGDIIREFSNIFDVDKQNKKKETALHIACAKGHHDAAFALLEMKAKSNIKNLLGETALHVVGLSCSSTPELARAILQHTIKKHDWESVNATDDGGNNALHLAGKFVEPDVLWEFRFVRFKDTDIDGNTPLHEAVRPDCPEALHTALDIYESMQRDANINQQNNNLETVLHLAASAGFSDCVSRLIFYGADLACQDASGNTVLHRLVKAIVEDNSKQSLYMNVVETIITDSVRWLCNRTYDRFPSENKSFFQQIQRKAILSLLNDFKNNRMLSVLGYASKYGCDVFLARMLTLPEVMSFDRDGSIYYDVSHLTPLTNGSTKGCFGETRVQHSVSLIELLVTAESTYRVSRVLDIAPIRQIEIMYSSIIAWAYAFLVFLHIAYMSVFTYLGVDISGKFRDMMNGTPLDATDPVLLATYIIVPLEPAIFLVNGFIVLIVTLSRRKLSSSEPYVILAVNLTLSCLVLTWLVLVAMREKNHDYILSICLCIGWLYTITFTRGFKKIHYFWKMLLSMLTRDVFRFMIVFLFVLLAFSFAFHVFFQISTEIVQTYTYTFDTMFLVFNTMVGMSNMFDDAFTAGMASVDRTSTFPKVMYVCYIVFSTIILLNLLIAMMNDSYSNILENQQEFWRVDSIKIGIGVENLMPWFPKYFGNIRIQKFKLTPEYDNSVGMRWYLQTSKEEIKLLCDNDSSLRDSKPLGGVLENRFKQMETRVDNIEKCIQDNFTKMFAMLDSMKPEKSKTN